VEARRKQQEYMDRSALLTQRCLCLYGACTVRIGKGTVQGSTLRVMCVL